MSPTLTVARRELREYRFVLFTAIALGAFPLVVTSLPALVRGQHEIGVLLALVFGTAIAPAAALGLGSSVISRDAASGRLQFYFARPLPALALWTGKCLAAVGLIVFAFVCTALPAMVLSRTESSPRDLLVGLPVFVFTGALFLFGASSVGSTVYRSRAPWLILDVVFALVTLSLLIAIFRRLHLAGAGYALMLAVPFVLLAGAAVMLGGTAAQLVAGRVDLRRGHAALSLTVWALSSVLLVGLWAFGSWVLAVPPAGLGVGHATWVAPRGAGLMFEPMLGRTAGRMGYRPIFLMNVETGAWTATSPQRMTKPVFSDDGRRAAWVIRRLKKGPWTPGPAIAIARFDSAAPTIEERPLRDDLGWNEVLALESSGPLAMLAGERTIGLVDTASGQLVRQFDARPRAADFLADGRVRVYAQEGVDLAAATLVVFDWERSGARIERLRVPGVGVWDHAGDHAVVSRGRGQCLLVDVALGTSVDLPHCRGSFLADGRLATVSKEGLQIRSPEGRILFSMPEVKGLAAGFTEDESGHLVVGIIDAERPGQQRTLVVDLAGARILRQEDGLLPAARWGQAPERGAPGTHLFVDARGALVRMGADGKREVLLAGRP